MHFKEDQQLINQELRLVSFDLWDTILRRNCHPDEIKLRLCRAHWALSRPKIDGRKCTPVELYWMRKKAEDSSADLDWEYKFLEAIKLYLSHFDEGDSISKEVDPKELEEIELAIEDSSTYIDKKAIRLLDQLSASIETGAFSSTQSIVISDFYHSSEWVATLLKKKDLTRYFAEVHSSSDSLCTKRSGQVYEKIISSNNIKPNTWLHIGDNEHADVAVPRSYGINAYHFTDPDEPSKQRSHALAFADHTKSTSPFLHSQRIERIISSERRSLPKNTLEHFTKDAKIELIKTGHQLAGLLIGYVLKIIEDALELGVKTIYFFSREGIFFKDLYDILIDLDVYDIGHRYPESSILRVSRSATFAASLRNTSTSELMRMWNLYSHQSPEAFCKSLNLEESIIRESCEKNHLSFSAQVQYPWLNDRFLSLLADENVLQHIEQRIEVQRSSLLAYLAKSTLLQENTIHIVDIGWRGTIQDNLAHLLPSTKIHGTYLGLSKFLNEQPSNCSKTGYLYDWNKTPNSNDSYDVAIYEFISNAPGGSVSSYTQDGEPIFKIVEGEERVINHEGALIQKGIKQAFDKVGRYIKSHGLTSCDLHSLSLDAFRRSQHNPPPALADAFHSLHHNETFGTGKEDQVLNLSALDNSFISGPSKHAYLQEAWTGSRWKEAFLKSTEISEYVMTLSSIQRLCLPSPLYQHFCNNLENKKTIILMPPLIRGSGGHRTILNLAKGLIRAGAEVEIQLEEFNKDNSYLIEEMDGYDYSLTQWWQPGSRCHIAIATVGYSAQFVAKDMVAEHKFYFVQDFEAEFNPMGDGYICIENSYAYGLIPLCIGTWLPHVLKTRYGLDSYYSGLGVDSTVYKRNDQLPRQDAIAFLYQPEKGRRMSDELLKALILVKQIRPSAQIFSYGSEENPPVELECEHLGLVQDLRELANLYSTAKIGLCISLTNPSRIPFEMMACGCVPIDVYRYNNLFDYEEGTALLVYQDSASIASAICDLLESNEDWQQRSNSCIDYVRPRTLQWEVDVLVNSVSMIASGKLHEGMQSPAVSYKSAAVFNHDSYSSAAIQRYCKWQMSLGSSSIPEDLA